jgi:hypothetical protein
MLFTFREFITRFKCHSGFMVIYKKYIYIIGKFSYIFSPTSIMTQFNFNRYLSSAGNSVSLNVGGGVTQACMCGGRSVEPDEACQERLCAGIRTSYFK